MSNTLLRCYYLHLFFIQLSFIYAHYMFCIIYIYINTWEADGNRTSLNATKHTILMRFSHFSWINVSPVAARLWVIFRVLKMLVLIGFVSVLVAFTDEWIFRSLHSATVQSGASGHSASWASVSTASLTRAWQGVIEKPWVFCHKLLATPSCIWLCLSRFKTSFSFIKFYFLHLLLLF